MGQKLTQIFGDDSVDVLALVVEAALQDLLSAGDRQRPHVDLQKPGTKVFEIIILRRVNKNGEIRIKHDSKQRSKNVVKSRIVDFAHCRF